VDLSPEARSSVAEGGYYSLPVMEGLRIISFNTDYGYRKKTTLDEVEGKLLNYIWNIFQV